MTPPIARSADERLLTFEVAGALYALPIAGVLEVAEAGRMACIPTLPTDIGGVINYHGDALPVVHGAALFDVDESQLPEPANILVVTDKPTDSARLGVPVDRVLGLVDGHAVPAHGRDAVAEHREIQGRVASVVDPKRLIAQAREVIESGSSRGGRLDR